MNTLRRLICDDRGTVLSAELVMLTTLLAVGVIVGAKSFRDGAVSEFADFAQAIGNFDQSFNIPNTSSGSGDGSSFLDLPDFCDTSADDDGPFPSSNTGSCTVYGVAATAETP